MSLIDQLRQQTFYSHDWLADPRCVDYSQWICLQREWNGSKKYKFAEKKKGLKSWRPLCFGQIAETTSFTAGLQI